MDGKWRIDENGCLVAKTVEAEEIKATKKLEVGSTENRTGITIYDETTGESMCAKSVNKVWTLTEGACGAAAAASTNNESIHESANSESTNTEMATKINAATSTASVIQEETASSTAATNTPGF